MDQSHPGTKCSSCKADPIVGVRMACLICKRYDLCGECHSKKRFSRKHRSYHPVQTILPPNEMERSLKDVHQDEIRIFRCPCCGDDELNVRELIGHCDEKCCICQESMKAEDCRKLTCSHSYHRECINQWLRDNNSCPNCRAEV
ncbi:E3 ubiquitin-protein ligase Kcmf1-like isoform X2 [Culex pipiens pallens]|uniref:E3 ubiquitin-protein ligase Kcmf1-like isoform X2 n=1 Tax=Culex pipiens pallens TaxID=42434 RepID=UPI0022A9F94A|nr:E3 ubiquitin-protein ligase Kcmf1-like isoform X2 [Culex pipiens pallens]